MWPSFAVASEGRRSCAMEGGLRRTLSRSAGGTLEQRALRSAEKENDRAVVAGFVDLFPET